MALAGAREFVGELVDKWSADQAATQGAALAYYALFSLAPLLVLVIAVAGLLLGQSAAESEVVSRLEDVVGPQSAHVLREMTAQLASPRAGIVASAVGLVTMAVGATGMLVQLQTSLVHIWGTHESMPRRVPSMLRQRAVGLGMILGLGLFVLTSMTITAMLTAIEHQIADHVPLTAAWGHSINFVVSFVLCAGLFALVYRVLPAARTPWPDLWVGGAVTALLFTLGKTALGWYLGRASTSIYGAAGSLVSTMLWVYYSAQILLAGAIFTVVWSRRRAARRTAA